MSNKEISLEFETLKKHIIDTLNEAIKTVREEDYKKAEQMTFYIPGDDHTKKDNNSIDFGFNGMELDFLEAFYVLKSLKNRGNY